MNSKAFDNQSVPKPLYEQLADDIYISIKNNDYPVRTKLPTEKELHLTTGMSRSTVRKALDLLVKADLVVKIHGKGSFVSGSKKAVNTVTHFTSLTENLAEMGKTAFSKVVNYEFVKPTHDQCEFFNINKNSTLLMIERLRYMDQKPFCIDTSWFTIDFESLVKEDLSGSLYTVLRKKYSVNPTSGSKTFTITYAGPNASFLLDVAPQTPLMLIQDSVYDENGKPLHLSTQQIRSDRYKYAINQKSLTDK